MKLSDALNENWGAGAQSLVTPSAFVGQQVVQPLTKQAVDPDQTHFNKKLRKKKPPKQVDHSKYNDSETDELDVYYKDDKKSDRFDDEFEKLLRKMKRVRQVKGLEDPTVTTWAYDDMENDGEAE